MDLPVPAQIDLPDEDATLAWGRQLAVQAELPLQVHLVGELGAGKTTLNRCLLEQLPPNTDVAIVLDPARSAVGLLATV